MSEDIKEYTFSKRPIKLPGKIAKAAAAWRNGIKLFDFLKTRPTLADVQDNSYLNRYNDLVNGKDADIIKMYNVMREAKGMPELEDLSAFDDDKEYDDFLVDADVGTGGTFRAPSFNDDNYADYLNYSADIIPQYIFNKEIDDEIRKQNGGPDTWEDITVAYEPDMFKYGHFGNSDTGGYAFNKLKSLKSTPINKNIIDGVTAGELR